MAKAKAYIGEAVLDLPTSLRLGPAFVGLLKPSVIAGIEVHVVLPDFEWDDGWFKPIVHPRAAVDWIASFREKREEDDPGFPFGRVDAIGEGNEVVSFWVTRLLVLPRAKMTVSEAKALRDAADGWMELLATWLDVVNRGDLRQETVQIVHVGKAAFVWIDKGEKGKVYRGRRIFRLNLGGIPLDLSPWAWGRVLKKAGADELPPEAHLFLRDARHARNIGRHRRSVLDSATAAELALANLRDGLVAGSDRRLAAYIGKEVRQLRGIADFLKAMDRQLPPEITQAIAEPRNKAIHQGHEPDEATATLALEKAEEVVDLAFPWKRLLR